MADGFRRGYDFRGRCERKLGFINYAFMYLAGGVRAAVQALGSSDVRVEVHRSPDCSVAVFIVWLGGSPWIILAYLTTRRVITPRDVRLIEKRVKSVIEGRDHNWPDSPNIASLLANATGARLAVIIVGDGTWITSGALDMLKELGFYYDMTGGRLARRWILRYLLKRAEALAETRGATIRGTAVHSVLAAIGFMFVKMLEYAWRARGPPGSEPPPVLHELRVVAVDYAVSASARALRTILDYMRLYYSDPESLGFAG